MIIPLRSATGTPRSAKRLPGRDLFLFAEKCLTSTDLNEKLTLTRQAKHLDELEQLRFDDDSGAPQPIAMVRFPERPATVDPRELPRRKLTTPDGRAALLHALAHIEFTAIHLACDLLYRFRGLPDEFYRDWLAVAAEEALHFELLRGRLRELGCDYGDLPAHRGLWEVAEETADDVAARLALVPRCMEARGLDVTPGMIAKFEQIGDEPSAAILRRILLDEVGHVALGSRWFRWVCEQRRDAPEDTYFRLVETYLRSEVRGPYNRNLRLQAGFTERELSRLEAKGKQGGCSSALPK